jgi:anionic cell wall polymer biosynthesis LytR-Cps2A-Psr (LCP) family protein
MKKYIFVFLTLVLVVLSIELISRSYFSETNSVSAEQVAKLDDGTEKILAARIKEREQNVGSTEVFDTNGKVNVLLLGLDKRVGQTEGHCDAIQMFTLDSKNQDITITALPRGTYSPLPPGKGTTSTDYYVSNACGLGGLEYGITQIEKILGQKADYVAIVGFSETLGIIRSLNLPTTETLQWLRRRHSYAIGEPQRARNHSTFLKTLLTTYLPKEKSTFDTAFQYLIYHMVETDLSFGQVQTLVETLRNMDLTQNPDRIRLAMKPAHEVQDIPYNPEHLDIKPGVDTLEGIQKKLLESINEKKNDPKFIVWAYDNDIWLQIEDVRKREEIRYDLLERYISTFEEKETQKNILADYILEKDNLGDSEWMEKGKTLLTKTLNPL